MDETMSIAVRHMRYESAKFKRGLCQGSCSEREVSEPSGSSESAKKSPSVRRCVTYFVAGGLLLATFIVTATFIGLYIYEY
ncbi:hypothetical protein Tcan_12093 [Toxocara canis]|uniref:Uncharacterized protein n=1 Tax=Toxocara canis TaxID=6265 RepID=A0A0B2UP88_TOXCA|nr:hypothetical protein Tcan_12093 [Toxocara canis]